MKVVGREGKESESIQIDFENLANIAFRTFQPFPPLPLTNSLNY